jgi:hypothetical protein
MSEAERAALQTVFAAPGGRRTFLWRRTFYAQRARAA